LEEDWQHGFAISIFYDYNSTMLCGDTWASLVAVNKLIQDHHLSQFLVGLNEEYKITRSS